MRKVLVWTTVIVVATGLGLGAAIGVGRWMSQIAPGGYGTPWTNSAASATAAPQPGWGPGAWGGGWTSGPGMMGGYGGGGMGMMYGGGRGQAVSGGQRLTIDDALQLASDYAARYGANLEVAEVMEFSNNFYAAVREADTGRGALEILIDPYTGYVSPEPGPNMMWNSRYGHMGGWGVKDNSLTLGQARDLAQKALDANLPGATAHEDGFAFYGYYTFDYDLNGQTAGMLSVNGTTGSAWLHTWHGQFITEKEVEQ